MIPSSLRAWLRRPIVWGGMLALLVIAGLAVCWWLLLFSPDLVGAQQANNRGIGHMEQFEYDAAVKAFEEAIRLAPGWLPQNPTWEVHTAEETYQGTIDVAHATTVSDNTVFAQLGADLGPQKIDQTAYAMGITSHLDAYYSEVLGGLKEGELVTLESPAEAAKRAKKKL